MSKMSSYEIGKKGGIQQVRCIFARHSIKIPVMQVTEQLGVC